MRSKGWRVRRAAGLSLCPPLAWELELMGRCLRAIPEFVTRHPQGGTRRATRPRRK
jgi:hypothetical protein